MRRITLFTLFACSASVALSWAQAQPAVVPEKPGIYLEDLFVYPEFRGQGIGKQLLAHVAQLAVNNNCWRVEWTVLDWNEPALGFYRKLGAKPLDDWIMHRLSGQPLQDLAATAISASAAA